MNKWFVILMLLVGAALQTHAQKRLSREEFVAKKQAYITRKACLTEKEAVAFFPLYHEMCDKINHLNRIIAHNEWEMSEGTHRQEEYGRALARINNSRIEAAKVEKAYYEKFEKFLSKEKIYRIHMAEIEFHRCIIKGMVNK